MKKEQIEQVIKTSWNRYYGLPEDSDSIRPSENFEKGFKDGAEWRISSVWHDAKDTQPLEREKYVIIERKSFDGIISYPVLPGKMYEKHQFNERWAYIDDLIPEKEGR